MKIIALNIFILSLFISCANESQNSYSDDIQDMTDTSFSELNPIQVFGNNTDSIGIVWSEKMFLGTPALFSTNGIAKMSIEDCAGDYCQGTSIYFNEFGFPIKEVSKNANSFYFIYEQEEPGKITEKYLDSISTSKFYNYNYTKEISYINTDLFYQEIITFPDSTKPKEFYNHINDSILVFSENRPDPDSGDTLINSFTKYVSLKHTMSAWKIRKENDKNIEVHMGGDIKIPGGDEYGGPLIIRYELDENKLITKIQFVNKLGLILKEVTLKYN